MSAKLHATRDYSLFTLSTFNRDVSKTARLIKSMKTYGYIPAYPIHVVRGENGKLIIKAGHHRFDVARSLGLSVYYVICEDAATVYELEAATNPWKLRDYLESYRRVGIESYIQVGDYIERTGIGLDCAISLLAGNTAGSGNCGRAFKMGTYRVTDAPYAETVAEVIGHCKAAGFAFATTKLFVTAISRVIWVPQFSPQRFMHKVTTHGAIAKHQPHLEGYMNLIETLYNRASQDKLPVTFLAAQVAKDRCAVKSKTTAQAPPDE